MLLQLLLATPSGAYPGDCLLSIGCRDAGQIDAMIDGHNLPVTNFSDKQHPPFKNLRFF